MRQVFVGAIFAIGACAQDHTLGYDNTPFLPDGKWRVQDVSRPRPPVITPGAEVGKPPSDPIVLFDGDDFSH